MDNKKLKMLDQLTRHVRKYMLISPEAFDNYPSNIDTVIVGIIEEDKGNYSFVCNSEDLSGDIDDFDFKDGYKVYLSVNGYDIDLYLICTAYINLD